MTTATRRVLRALAMAGGLLVVASARGGAAAAVDEKLHVVTTISVLGDISRSIGGDRVTVRSLSDPRQNPHFVEARPTLMKRARQAQVFVQVGVQLEPWARGVILGSGNPRIQAGQPGHVVASHGISTLEVPPRISREEGNIHPFGNPYIWLDPLNVKHMAANIAEGLVRVDPEHRAGYQERLEEFRHAIDEALFGAELVGEVGGPKLDRLTRQGRLTDFLEQRGLTGKLGGWLREAEKLRGRPVVSYHKTWIYFSERFGFTVPVEIEEKPGTPPSARHRDRVLRLMRDQGVHTVLIETYQDGRTTSDMARRAGANVVVVPIDVGAEVNVASYFELIDLLIDRLVESERGS